MQSISRWKTAALLCLCLGLTCLTGAIPASALQPNVVAFGESLAPGSATLLLEGRVYLAAERLAETLGLSYDWDAANRVLYLNSYRSEPVSATGSYLGYPQVALLINGERQSGSSPAILVGQTPYLPLRTAEAFGLAVGWNAATRTGYIGSERADQLPRVGSAANLEKLLSGAYYYGTYRVTLGAPEAMATAKDDAGSAATDYSQTNVQVQGVDEADIVKTDGQFIYQARGGSVLISRAYPAEQLQLVATITADDQTFNCSELFLDGDQLLVIGQSNSTLYCDLPAVMPAVDGAASKFAPGLMPPAYWSPTTKLQVYNISDRAQPKLARAVELDGSYLTARKVDSRVVLLANQPVYREQPVPTYRDTACGEATQSLPLADVQYFPERRSNSYLLTACLDLQNDQPAAVAAYLGAGDNVFMSKDNLYVATGRWWGNETNVYKLHLDGTDLSFQAKGAVPGYLLNQFSLDEWQGNLRVATTSEQDGRTVNGVYVLNDQLNLVGQLAGIAPGERIYSARFAGERGYLVTFEQVDPLFVLDLADPTKPAILGALKIPGFSSYLHPIDDHHLLGIGRDTQVVEDKDIMGRVVNTRVLERGLKLAIFDVSDLANPVEMSSVLVGGRGSYSEALSNHKAVLYDAKHQLLALPAQLTATSPDAFSYGPVVFQGALVYQVSLEQGLQERGRVTHLTAAEQQQSGYYGVAAAHSIQRVLYLDDTLYCISNGTISAHELPGLALLKSIELP